MTNAVAIAGLVILTVVSAYVGYIVIRDALESLRQRKFILAVSEIIVGLLISALAMFWVAMLIGGLYGTWRS